MSSDSVRSASRVSFVLASKSSTIWAAMIQLRGLLSLPTNSVSKFFQPYPALNVPQLSPGVEGDAAVDELIVVVRQRRCNEFLYHVVVLDESRSVGKQAVVQAGPVEAVCVFGVPVAEGVEALIFPNQSCLDPPSVGESAAHGPVERVVMKGPLSRDHPRPLEGAPGELSASVSSTPVGEPPG